MSDVKYASLIKVCAISRMKQLLVILFSLLLLNGCVVFSFPDNLAKSILNQDDPEIVRAGAPAFLIILDTLIESDPKDEDYLLAGAQLYSAYAGAFAENPERAKKLSDRALNYGRRALCQSLDDLCAVVDKPYDDYIAELNKIDSVGDLPFLYGFVTAWAGWIQAHFDDWHAIADLPKVKASIQKVLDLDDGYQQGEAHIYMGVLETQLPPSIGGKPEVARAHFERAMLLSKERNLMAKVLYAQQYARLLFNQELHDRLLNEVLTADPQMEGFTLINTLAQEQARRLLESSQEYFE